MILHSKYINYQKKGTLEKEFPKELYISKGQVISKRFFLAEDSPKKRTKTRRILLKMNSFVRFLGESSARKKRFEII